MSRRVRWRSERGSLSLGVALFFSALIVAVGIVGLDGGRKFGTYAEAHNLAANAARAGGQAINVSSAVAGSPKLDRDQAIADATQYLAEQHRRGTVEVDENAVTVTVTVTIEVRTVFLPGPMTVRATESARAQELR